MLKLSEYIGDTNLYHFGVLGTESHIVALAGLNSNICLFLPTSSTQIKDVHHHIWLCVILPTSRQGFSV